MESKSLNYFKFLFPSWSFFDESSDTPVLLYKTNQMQVYQVVMRPNKVKLMQLFYNPDQNLYLNFHSTQQQLLNDIYEGQKKESFNILKLNSFQRSLNFIRWRTRNENYSTFDIKFSFIKNSGNNFSEIDSIFEITGLNRESN